MIILAWRIAMLLCCAACVGGGIYAGWALLRRLFHRVWNSHLPKVDKRPNMEMSLGMPAYLVLFMAVREWTFAWAVLNGPAPDPDPFTLPDFSHF